jgi:hypothetical protein
MAKAAETRVVRCETTVWLLRKVIEKLPTCQIPTQGDVLRYFFYLKDGPMKHEKFRNFNGAVAEKVLVDVQKQWEMAGIETQRKDKVKSKILDLYGRYRLVQKSKGKESNEQKEQSFTEDMTKYFFIAHQNAQHKIESDRLRQQKHKDEDVLFLKALKDGTKVSLGTEDKVYGNKVAKKLHRDRLELCRKDAEQKRKKEQIIITEADASASAIYADIAKDIDEEIEDEDEIEDIHFDEGAGKTPDIQATETNIENDNASDLDFEAPSTSGSKRKKPATITLQLPRNPYKSPKVSQMADRLNLSAGQSTAFMAAIVTEGGGYLDLN